MARAIHWQVTFVAFDGTKYQANIYDDDYTGSVVPLTGASVPFETQEDDDDDWTKPIRTSTGYLRIVTDSLSLVNEIMPSSSFERYVELYSVTDSETCWCGYIQQQSFDNPLYDGMSEVEFPLISYLGAQLNDYLSTNFEGYVTIGEFIKGLCGDVITSVCFSDNDLFTPTTVTDITGQSESTPVPPRLSFYLEAFKEQLDLCEWANHQDFYDGTYEPKQKQEVMEAICQLFGWVMMENKTSIIFKAIGDESSVNYVVYSPQQLSVKSPVVISRQPAVKESLEYISNDHNSTHVLPFKSFSFKDSDVKKSYEVFSGDFDNFNYNGLTIVTSTITESLTNYHGFTSLVNTLVFQCHRYSKSSAEELPASSASLFKLDNNGSTHNYFGGEYGYYHHLNGVGNDTAYQGFLMERYEENQTIAAFTVRPWIPIWGYAGRTSIATYFTLSIEGNAYFGNWFDVLRTDDELRYVDIAIKVGDKYFDGTNYLPTSDTPVKLKAMVKSGKLLWSQYLWYNGSLSHILNGQIEVTFYTHVEANNLNYYYLLITDLKISVEYADSRDEMSYYNAIHTYESHLHNTSLLKNLNPNGQNEYSIESAFCGDMADASLVSPDCYYPDMAMKYVGSYTDNPGLEGLGLRLYSKLSDRLSQPHEVQTLTVRDYPDAIDYIRVNGKTYHILSRSRNWRDSQTILKIIDLS